MTDEQNKKIELLYKAIEDNQLTIRFLDTKLTITTFILGVYAAAIGAGLGDFSKYFWNMLCWQQTVFIGLLSIIGIGIIAEAILIIITVFPASNPVEHINLNSYSPCNMFYLAGMEMKLTDYLKISKKTKLTPSFDIINASYAAAVPDVIQNELICELMKVSFIRELKLKRVKLIKSLLLPLVVISPVLLALHFWGVSYYIKSCPLI